MTGGRILITGGAGYIGSWLVKSAVEAGFRPIVLDHAAPVDSPLAGLLRSGKVEYLQGSILDEEVLNEACRGAAAVIHLAAVSDGLAGKRDPETTRRVNTEPMQGLIEACRNAGVRRFLFASTFGVYGNKYSEILNEELPALPVDPYSESKVRGEEIVRAANTSDFATASIRMAMVYGLGLKVREDFLVNALCRTAVHHGKLQVQGGTQRRPQIHIRDVGRLFLSLLEGDASLLNGDAFNLVESNPSVREIAETIQEILPDLDVEFRVARDHEDSFELSGNKLARQFGFQPAISLEAGMKELIHYFKSAGRAELI